MSSFSQINTNIQSLQAFQNLSDTSEELQTRQERLTTGLRINSAEDDAAGFQIANQLEAKTGAQQQALRNIGDAKSALSTAEGALDSQLDILQTAKQKATQAANGSLSQNERDAIAGELNQLGQEINDIQQNATFNGDQLLNGDGNGNDKTFKFQTGASSENQKGQFQVDLSSSGTTDLGIGGNIDLSTTNGLEEALSVGQGDFGSNEGPDNLDSSLVDGVTNLTGSSAVAADTTASSEDLAGSLEGGEFNVKVTDDSGGTDQLTFQVEKDGEIVNTQTVGVGSGETPGSGTDANVTLETDGSNEIAFNAGQAFDNGDVTGNTTKEFTVEVTDGQLGDQLKGDSGSTEARNIISNVDSAIETVTSQLSDIGASQNRLSFKESNLETSRTNLESARSQIEDADFAREQTRVAKLQVLQQSGTAQLAQANAAGQSVLSLLGG